MGCQINHKANPTFGWPFLKKVIFTPVYIRMYIAHVHSNCTYVIVKSRYKGGIVFITQSQARAEAEGNKNNITRVDGFYPSVTIYVINFL